MQCWTEKIHDVLMRSWLQRERYSPGGGSQLYKTWQCHQMEGTRVKECGDSLSSGSETKISTAVDWRLALCCLGALV